MRELSLFSGAGGGLLGTKLLGFRAVGYVEWETYPQKVLQARIADGYLDAAPIFGDIRRFVADGYAEQYQGMADLVSAGFPCQPFSVAGKQAAADDPRNMWPATRDVLAVVRPAYALLENVPGLLATGYGETIFRDLAALGFDAEWGVFSAAECGAPHLRERLFIVAHAKNDTRIYEPNNSETSQGLYNDRNTWRTYPWNEAHPRIRRMDDGLAHSLDRYYAIGNGQVPAVVARAWRELSARFH